jgi:hypothetical protein
MVVAALLSLVACHCGSSAKLLDACASRSSCGLRATRPTILDRVVSERAVISFWV